MPTFYIYRVLPKHNIALTQALAHKLVNNLLWLLFHMQVFATQDKSSKVKWQPRPLIIYELINASAQVCAMMDLGKI